MSRLDVTEKIVATKVAKGLKWADVAAKVGQSKAWWPRSSASLRKRRSG
jgi:cyanate lyase